MDIKIGTEIWFINGSPKMWAKQEIILENGTKRWICFWWDKNGTYQEASFAEDDLVTKDPNGPTGRYVLMNV